MLMPNAFMGRCSPAVPPLLRQRCRIIRLGPPRPQDFDVLLAGCLDDLAMEYGCELEDLPELESEVIEAMRWTFATGRMQARQLAALVPEMPMRMFSRAQSLSR